MPTDPKRGWLNTNGIRFAESDWISLLRLFGRNSRIWSCCPRLMLRCWVTTQDSTWFHIQRSHSGAIWSFICGDKMKKATTPQGSAPALCDALCPACSCVHEDSLPLSRARLRKSRVLPRWKRSPWTRSIKDRFSFSSLWYLCLIPNSPKISIDFLLFLNFMGRVQPRFIPSGNQTWKWTPSFQLGASSANVCSTRFNNYIRNIFPIGSGQITENSIPKTYCSSFYGMGNLRSPSEKCDGPPHPILSIYGDGQGGQNLPKASCFGTPSVGPGAHCQPLPWTFWAVGLLMDLPGLYKMASKWWIYVELLAMI